jgi:hypothetical protein
MVEGEAPPADGGTPAGGPTGGSQRGDADAEVADPVDSFVEDITGADPQLIDALGGGAGPTPESSTEGAPAPSDPSTKPAPTADTPKGEESQAGISTDTVATSLTSTGTSTISQSDAFPSLHELFPDVSADGKLGGVSVGQPTIDNGAISVETPLGPATAALGVDDKGHLTATITEMPWDPTEKILPSEVKATEMLQGKLDAYNRQLDQNGVHLTGVKADDGQLILTKVPNASPPAGSGAAEPPKSPE